MNKPRRPPFLNVFLVQTKTSQAEQFRPLLNDGLNSVKIQKYNVQIRGLYALCKHLHPFFISLKEGCDLSLINIKPIEILSVVNIVYLRLLLVYY